MYTLFFFHSQIFIISISRMAVSEKTEVEREREMISFGVYKPRDGHDIDDVVSHLKALISTAEREKNKEKEKSAANPRGSGSGRSVIVKSVNGSWAAVFCISTTDFTIINKREDDDDDDDVIKLVEWGSFQLITEEHKNNWSGSGSGIGVAVSVGDIVSVRRIYTDSKNQEVIAYSCLAVLKAYFAQIEGLVSCAFYKSRDAKLIMGLGIWDSADSASAFLDSRRPSPGEAYWKDLGANNLKYEVCQVVYSYATTPKY